MRAFFYALIFIIKTIMNFFKNMLSSGSKISSKRTVTFVCLLFMLLGYTANLFWDYTIDTKLFESLQWIVMAGLGFTAAENFSPKVEEAPVEKEPSHTTVTHEYDYENDYVDESDDDI
jgi:hypothetical protein|tara:strand:- start:942 stop:1295 length:354 start_codon:yes stop_codon:yes gene_type:complete